MRNNRTPIPVHEPKISVLLLKNVAREYVAGGDGLGSESPASGRFKGVQNRIDLTPYLGESGGVRTAKGVREPAGSFTVTLADKIFNGDNAQMESLYGLIEPMDVIEIRMAHAPTSPGVVAEYQGLAEQLPIIMRGFVTSPRRMESIDPSGRPQRSISISGMDYGKLWQIIQIRYLANYVLGQELLTTLKFAQNYGVNSNVDFTPNQFIYEVVQSVLNSFTTNMRTNSGMGFDEMGDSNSPVRDIEVFDLTVPDARVSAFGANSFSGGTLYQMLCHYGDVGPWNELYMEDREDGVAIVYRPNPFFTPGNDLVNPPVDPYEPPDGEGFVQGLGIVTIEITDIDVISLNTGRSDANLANYYWVDNPSFSLIQGETLRLQAAGLNPETYFIENYRNSAPWLYGLRMMQVQTNQGGRFDSQKEQELLAGKGALQSWLDERRAILVANNRDNVVFESGQMVLKGNEQIKAGMYLRVWRGNMYADYYLTRVEHSFMPFRSFITTVTFERGTGFIERAKRGNGLQSPYLSELNGDGVYRSVE